jgi:hypothetical protein
MSDTNSFKRITRAAELQCSLVYPGSTTALKILQSFLHPQSDCTSPSLASMERSKIPWFKTGRVY